MADWLYSDIVKDHFMNPRNVLMEDESTFAADGRGETGNIKCGDQMLVLLKIKDDVITDVRWKTYGCASAIASTSMLSETIKGMTIEDAYNVKPEDLVDKLGGLPNNKIHCSVLGDKALRAAIDDYLNKTGRSGLFKEEATVVCECLGITDKDLEEAYKNGARTWEDLQQATKIGTVCGKCKGKSLELLHEFSHIYGDD
ncbi:iron-sulfur cluster assembly scaffold protein [Breznakiella homolactica]|uniref:Iron-sulfur cluster assembly scaffold protein n=1 Tax=Breznakiella homolactica TaxID=2798577 RepID=A0A7T7XRP5_9SPIR|nr:iron-sulfur cluster assembly scaffold protein [Breznakiella homolactica]QQO11260.1 iron-sulfur cluster assembly scaffold protein [Breznakiella homolactica]